MAATNNSADESTGEKPRIIRVSCVWEHFDCGFSETMHLDQICAGLCVALDASCSRAEEVVEDVDGELVDNPDEYFDEGDGEFFDIRCVIYYLWSSLFCLLILKMSTTPAYQAMK